MKTNRQKKELEALAQEIDSIIAHIKKLEKNYQPHLAKVHPRFEKSARNLVHYRSLRTLDIRGLQKQLGNRGLSRLARAEGHIMASLLMKKRILESLAGKKAKANNQSGELTIKASQRLEKTNTKALLGYRSKNRQTRIMVTLPTAAATDYKMVYDMVNAGMNCARINCAHDDATVWGQMIKNVKKASKQLKRNCKVAMDLGGPKIRTGALKPGPKIRKYRPFKNNRGEVVEPCEIWMGSVPSDDPNLPQLPVKWKNLDHLRAGDQLTFRDARGKKRILNIVEIKEEACIVRVYKTFFMETGMKTMIKARKANVSFEVLELPTLEQAIILYQGDFLRLHKAMTPGENAQVSKKGKTKAIAHLSCTLPIIFKEVKPGEPIFFDDGKIQGIIREASEEELIIEIVHALATGSKLKADKGINLPISDLKISGLTEKDKRDLKFVVKHADVVNLSFVNRPQDIRDLYTQFDLLKAPEELGVILKIETQSGFNQLTDILLEAMQAYPIGVMIARGDLAVECGWENIGRVQTEILTLCQAAKVPTIWATQVLESLSKQGIPSRAEVTDASMSQRADCVMLNKGPYILRSIQFLNTILQDLDLYHHKHAMLLPKLRGASEG